MKTNVFLGLGIRIIIVFSVAMLMTFAPDELRDFFGDSIHDCSVDCGTYSDGSIRHRTGFCDLDSGYNWGARHYWYWWMCFLLFILSFVNAVVGAVNLVNKNYKL